MSNLEQIVLVTGASGFVGAQVVEQLLANGYTVRGTCRSNKAEELKKNNSHPDFTVVVADDLVKGDFTDALEGVSALIHVASPLPHGDNHLEVALEGTMNILRQSYDAGIRKIAVISSFYAAITKNEDFWQANVTLNNQSWGEPLPGSTEKGADGFALYAASKILAERAVWKFSDEHPDANIITLLPGFIFGPIAKSQVIKGHSDLSANGYLYTMLAGANASYTNLFPDHPLPFIDVRDVARACVLALSVTPAKPGYHHRYLLYSGSWSMKEMAQIIGKVRPTTKDRLVERGEGALPLDAKPATKFDTLPAKEVLGLKEFIPVENMIGDTVDSLLEREASWSK
ncbi:hypothetical protein BU17DRAFT_63725 [Hysterangium stoloniferum]|nr:hypothetical protein BU17DRAFT_63725 [Hysterangium stoloniferum]